MSGCPYKAAVEAAERSRPTSLLRRLALRWRSETARALTDSGSLFVPPTPPRRTPIRSAFRALGSATADFLNADVFDVRLGRHSLNPIRIGHDTAELWYGGVDPNVPREYFGMLGALFRGGWNTPRRARRYAEKFSANKARNMSARERGEPVNPFTPDGDTWVYTVPSFPLVEFDNEDAVDSGYEDLPGLLMPVYCVKGATALKRVFTHPDFDRGAVPYHLLAQATGSSTIEPTEGVSATGLFAGRVHDNRTWKSDRRMGLQLVGPKALEGLMPGMRAALDDITAEIEQHIATQPDQPIDGTVMMSRIAYRMIIRAAIGEVDDERFQEMGRALTEPVRAVINHIMVATNGFLTDKEGFIQAIRTCKAIFGEMAVLIQQMESDGAFTDAQRQSPLVSFVLDGDGESGPPDHDRLYAFLMPIIFGGHETTGFTLSWALLELARDRDLEQSYLDELSRFQDRHPNGVDRLSTYDERPLQQALLYEIGRRYPPIFAVPRTAMRDGVMPADEETGIGAFRYPKDALFLAEISALHMDPDVYPEPQRFDVGRFLPDEPMNDVEAGRWTRRNIRQLEKRFRYILFGAGPAKCLGQPFNQLEFNLVLDHLLPQFRFELVDAQREVKPTDAAISGPEAGGLAVWVRRRL